MPGKTGGAAAGADGTAKGEKKKGKKKAEDPLMTGALLILYPVLQRLCLAKETFVAIMENLDKGLLPDGKGIPRAAEIREQVADWGRAFVCLEGQGDLEHLLYDMPFMHAGLFMTLATTISQMSRLVPYSRTALAVMLNGYYGELQKLALRSIAPFKHGEQESDAGEGSPLLPKPFTPSLVRYLLSLVPAMLPGRDLLRLLLSLDPTGHFHMGVLLDGECLMSASHEVEVVHNPKASARLSDMLRLVAKDDPVNLTRVSWLTEDPVLHKPLWAWVSVLEGAEGTSVTIVGTADNGGVSVEEAPRQEEQQEETQEQDVEEQGGGGGEERPPAVSEGDRAAANFRLQICFGATEEPVEVEDGAGLVWSLGAWMESLALASTYLVAFWGVKAQNVFEKTGFTCDSPDGMLSWESMERQATRPETPTLKRWGFIGWRLASNARQLLQNVTVDGSMLVLHVIHMDHSATNQKWMERTWTCEICGEMESDQRLRMSLNPCAHGACSVCCQRIAEGRSTLVCPFCRTTVVPQVYNDLVNSAASQRLRQGGKITHTGPAAFEPASTMAALANKSSDVKERPSPPLQLVKVVLHERGGGVGTATGFVEDGLKLTPIVLQNGPAGLMLFTSHDKDGRYECASLSCMALEPEDGSKRWATCGQCHVTRYCSRECQRQAWGQWHHRRICKKYKHYLDQTAAAGAGSTTPATQKQEEGRGGQADEEEPEKKAPTMELAIDLDDEDDA